MAEHTKDDELKARWFIAYWEFVPFFLIGLIIMTAGLVVSLFQHEPAETMIRWVSLFAFPFISAIGVVRGAWFFFTARLK